MVCSWYDEDYIQQAGLFHAALTLISSLFIFHVSFGYIVKLVMSHVLAALLHLLFFETDGEGDQSSVQPMESQLAFDFSHSS